MVRKNLRTHGTENLIEGHFSPGSEVVILDDVTTNGSSVKKAVDTIRSQGCEVKAVSKRARRKWNIIDFRDAYEPIYELS